MGYKNEFPSFDYELPNLGAKWVDDSWHNDVCPKIYNGKLVIWCDYLDPERREIGGQQFIVSSYIEDSYEHIQQFDTFADALAFCQTIKE